MWRWLVNEWQWPRASLFTAVFLFVMLPPLAIVSGAAVALVFVQLPIYQLHQWEEHHGDRFRNYVNRVIAGGREVLTPGITFWINCLGVWAVDLVALYLAVFVSPAAGLVAGYLTLVNAVIHIVQALVRREYNPGLATAVFLFLPIGGGCIWEAGANAGLLAHAIGFRLAAGGHALIVVVLASRLVRLRKSG
jgi:hypothetical protein